MSVKLGDFKMEDEVTGSPEQEKNKPEKVEEQLPEEKDDFSVDEVLDMDPEQEEDIFSSDLEKRRAIVEAYFPLPEDFPSEEKIEEWKNSYGKLRIHRVAPLEAYIVRPLTRSEYREYLNIISARYKTAEEASSANARMDQEEMLVEKCLLYPAISAEDISGKSVSMHKIHIAGTISVLSYDIEEISNLVESSLGPFEEL